MKNEETNVTSKIIDNSEEYELKIPTYNELSSAGLSKRNQKFMHKVIELVKNDKQYVLVIQKIQEELLKGQKNGKTARQIYGTPSMALGIQTEYLKKQKYKKCYSDFDYWDLVLDNMLTFLMLFSAMFGITLLFQKKAAVNAGAAGLLALVLTSISGGVLFALITKIMARHDLSKVLRVISTVLAFILWFLIYMIVSVIPNAINPVLPGWIYFIISILSFVGFRLLRKKTGIVGGFMGRSQISDEK